MPGSIVLSGRPTKYHRIEFHVLYVRLQPASDVVILACLRINAVKAEQSMYLYQPTRTWLLFWSALLLMLYSNYYRAWPSSHQ